MTNNNILYYVHDPMCSWCWGFQKAWQVVLNSIQDNLVLDDSLNKNLNNNLTVHYIVGGLAPDSDEPMPIPMQEAIAGYWKNIQARIPGTEFNFDFWEQCEPRRSTYPACRAVLAAKTLDSSKEQAMINAIQEGYYKQAKNPSNIDTLTSFAKQIGLDATAFEQAINSEQINHALMEDITLSRSMGAQGFPSLIIKVADNLKPIFIDYNNPNVMIDQIKQALSS